MATAPRNVARPKPPRHAFTATFSKDPQVRRWLNSRAYGQMRLQHLSDNPLCAICGKGPGRSRMDMNVDHIRPHRGDHGLFWDHDNLQTLCPSCHSRKTAGEDGGFGNER